MSTTALTIAVILYGVVTVALVAWFVHEASTYERKWRHAQRCLSAAYYRESTLERELEDKADVIYQLRQRLNRPAALDDEPPEGSIVAVPGCLPWTRNGLPDAPWSTGFDDTTWVGLWTSDLRVLRWGWGE